MPVEDVVHLLKPDEAAARLRVAEQTLAQWRVRGQGPPFAKIGGTIRYDSAALAEWIRTQTRGATQ